MKKNKAINLSNGYKDEHPILFFDNGRGPGTASPNTNLHIEFGENIYSKVAKLNKELADARKVIEASRKIIIDMVNEANLRGAFF